MKWNEVPNGATVQLLQDLIMVPGITVESTVELRDKHMHQYMTRAELDVLVDVVHKAGTCLSYSLEDEELQGITTNAFVGVSNNEEVDPTLYKILI